MQTATPAEVISIHGAREHNLKNISLTIPRNQFVVVTGVSGSGKSTLAFDLLFAEGQRRFLDSMNALCPPIRRAIGPARGGLDHRHSPLRQHRTAHLARRRQKHHRHRHRDLSFPAPAVCPAGHAVLSPLPAAGPGADARPSWPRAWRPNCAGAAICCCSRRW